MTDLPPPPDADAAPLLAAWVQAIELPTRPFTIPGHKRRAERVWPELGSMLRDDVPLYGGLESVKRAAGLLEEAEAAGAQAWGGDWCRYLTGGSTQANQILLLALGRPGDTVLVARSAHRSTVSGLALAGLRPVWIPADIDAHTGMPTGLSLRALTAALDAHPDAVGLLCVEPGYVGTLSDLPQVVAACHERNVPVVVDQAWAGHLGFHDAYPRHALQSGADAMVLSAHKTLAGYSQAAIAVARTGRVRRHELDRAADALVTTSPAGTLLAGCDASRALLTSPLGHELLDRLRATVSAARVGLCADGVLPLDDSYGCELDYSGIPTGRLDPAKLVIRLSGVDGLAVERDLLAAGIPLEQADRDTLVPIVTMFDQPSEVEHLVAAIRHAVAAHPASGHDARAPLWHLPAPTTVLPPRDAFFAAHEAVPASEAVGRVSAELVAPYPPGIPVLAPGELITSEIVALLGEVAGAGSRIAYASDPALASYRVVVG